MTIDNELIDKLLKDYKKPEDLIGENGLLKQLTKQLLERAMAAELTEHVGYEKHEVAGQNSGNSRNGKSAKTLKGSFGTMPIAVPRDRNGPSHHRSLGSIKRASPASMNTSFRCMRAACPSGRSSSLWKRFTKWKSRRP